MQVTRPLVQTVFAICLSVQVFGQPAKLKELPDITSDFNEIGEVVYFTVGSNALWRTDGTASGTLELGHAIYPDVGTFREFNGSALFLAGSNQLWISDGTPGGTTMLIARDNIRLLDYNSSFFFFSAETPSTGAELYRTDGTPGGTTMIGDLNPGTANGVADGPALVVGDVLFYPGNDGALGVELWKADGITQQLVSDINPGSGDGVVAGTNGWSMDGKFFFRGYTAASGEEPWVSDGTASGTHLLFDVAPGSDHSGDVDYVIAHNDRLFVVVTDRHDPGVSSLLVSQGTAASTELVWQDAATLHDFRAYRDNVYFWYFRGATYSGVWTSDGTSAGTHKAFDYMIDGPIVLFDVVDDHLVFMGNNQGYPTDIYTSTGTQEGTKKLAEFQAVAYGIAPRDFTRLGDRLFFADHDGPSDRGYSGRPHVPEDAYHVMEASSREVVSLRTLWGINTTQTEYIETLGEKLVFVTRDESVGTEQLWIYDPSVRPAPEPRFFLVSPTTDKDLKRLIDDASIPLSPFGIKPSYNIRFEPSVSPASVVFEMNGIVVRTEDSAPYSIGGDVNGDFSALDLVAGQHTITAKAYSQPGGTGTLLESLTISFDVLGDSDGGGSTPYDVQIVSPSEGAEFQAPADVLLEASAVPGDEGVIVRMEFFAGPRDAAKTKIGEDTEAPYSFLWENVPAGSYEVIVYAVDDANNKVGSSPVAVTVNPANAATIRFAKADLNRARLKTINIYPNPLPASSSELFLAGYDGLNETITTDVTIRNMTGEVIFSGRVDCGGDCTSYALKIDQALPVGIYLIEMKAGDVRHTRRLLVE